MHAQHDLDLIAAFVEGTLEDPAAAEALMESCPDCVRQAEAHRRVLAEFAAEEIVPMTDLERHRLHAAVWEELRSVAHPETVPPRAAPTTPWWYRVVPVAAALVVVVGVVAGLTGDGGTDESLTNVAAQLQPPADPSSPRQDGQEEADTAGAGEMYAATTMAAAADTTAAAELRGYDTEDLASATAGFAERAASEPVVDEDALACVDEAEVARVVAAEQAYVEGEDAWFIGFRDSAGGVTVEVYLASSCAVIFPVE